jgi:hypothetical protein
VKSSQAWLRKILENGRMMQEKLPGGRMARAAGSSEETKKGDLQE